MDSRDSLCCLFFDLVVVMVWVSFCVSFIVSCFLDYYLWIGGTGLVCSGCARANRSYTAASEKHSRLFSKPLTMDSYSEVTCFPPHNTSEYHGIQPVSGPHVWDNTLEIGRSSWCTSNDPVCLVSSEAEGKVCPHLQYEYS